MRRLLKTLLLCIFLALAIIFSLANHHDATLFLPDQTMVMMPMHLFVFSIFMLAITIGTLSASWYYHRKISQQKKALKLAQREADALRKELSALQTEERGRLQLRYQTNDPVIS